MNLDDIREAYLAEGFGYLDASSRTCQDVVLALISKSPLSRNVTIKGGVVMQHLTGDSRRATLDLDLDFIRYSLSEESIKTFISNLDAQSDDIDINIISQIEELKHQDYKGKRLHIRIKDNVGTYIDTRLDIGVHKNIDIDQTLYCFDLNKLDDRVSLLINTKEQIFTEKLKILLRLANLSTRYKDIFDMYWLIEQGSMNRVTLQADIKSIIFNDVTMREKNTKDIISRLRRAFDDHHFIRSLSLSRRQNWLEIAPNLATDTILRFIQEI
jgi:hypothetical protein